MNAGGNWVSSPQEILFVGAPGGELEAWHRALEDQGYRVRTAQDGPSTLQAVAVQAPDLILIEAGLQDPDGLELCRRLKAEGPGQALPVLLVCSPEGPLDAVHGLEAGAQDCLTRSLRMTEALARIKTHLKLHAQTRELERVIQHQAASLAEGESRLERGVHDRELAEAALGRSESRFLALFQEAPIALAIVHRDGAVLETNKRFRQLFGYEPAEVATLAQWWWLAYPDPDYRASVLESWNSAVTRASATGADIEALEHRVRCKDGSERLVIISGNAQNEEILAMFLDVTERRKAEEALRVSEERLRLALDATSDGLWDWNVPTGMVYRSPHYYDLMEREAGEQSQSFEFFQRTVHPEDLPRVLATIQAHAQGLSTSIEFEYRLQGASPKQKWLRVRGRAVERDASGAPLRIVGTLRDITERREADQARKESEARFSAIFQRSPLAMVLTRQADGLIVEVNDKFTEIHGYTRAELIGRTSTELNLWADAAARNAMIRELMAKGHCRDLEIKGYRKPGTTLDLLISVELIEVEGEAYTLGLAQDITERKRVENALRESEALFSTAFNYSPIPLSLSDPASEQWIEVNEAFLTITGYTRPEIIGHTFREIHLWRHPEDRERMQQRFAEQGRVVGFEVEIIKKSGAIGIMLISVENVDLSGRSLLLIMGDEITERKRAEAELRSLNAELERRVIERTQELVIANRELDAFSFAVSHDLKAPLRAMDGYAKALLEDFGASLESEARDYLAQITQASRRMGDLIEGLLALSRQARAEMAQDPIDLSALATRLLESLAQGEPERSVAWTVEPGLTAIGDPRMIDSVLQNLLSNAWKYTAKVAAPVIRVYWGELRGLEGFCVRDNGAGFDMNYAEHLFEPFRRLHRQEEFPGLGIGLATVARIIHRHGGSICAQASPGVGATFCFTLPGKAS